MADFKFINIPSLDNWVISAPKRAKRPEVQGKKPEHFCPFDPGHETNDPEVFRIGGEEGDRN